MANPEAAISDFPFVGDNGFFGFSVSEVDRDTGLPLGVHTHAHGEEEHHDEDEHHDEEEHHEDDHDEGHDEHAEEVEFVRIDMEKTRYDLKSEYRAGFRSGGEHPRRDRFFRVFP